jgi:hypothetical protein
MNTAKDIVKAGSERKLKIDLTNTSGQKLMITRENGTKAELDYTFEVVDEKGNPAPLTKYGRAVIKGEAVLVGAFGYVPVLPGESLKGEVVVTNLYDLSSPQKYTIQVHRFDEVSKIEVKSRSIMVTVVP